VFLIFIKVGDVGVGADHNTANSVGDIEVTMGEGDGNTLVGNIEHKRRKKKVCLLVLVGAITITANKDSVRKASKQRQKLRIATGAEVPSDEDLLDIILMSYVYKCF